MSPTEQWCRAIKEESKVSSLCCWTLSISSTQRQSKEKDRYAEKKVDRLGEN